MLRLSMNELTTFRWSFEEDAAEFAAAGYGGIGIWRAKLSDVGEDRAVDILRENRLNVSNLLWAGGFTGGDGRSYRDSVRDAVEAIRTAAALQAECLVIYSGSRAGHTHNHARRIVQNALRELLPYARRIRCRAGNRAYAPGVQ